eukprot:SAG22_NODE_943_length_6400_cov_3.214093_6_plen_187_part_00
MIGCPNPRGPTDRCIAGSTDDGLVRLFNYPVVVERAPHHKFRGHCSHVQNCRWLLGDCRVISAGGRDGSMMQWTTHGVTRPSKSKGLQQVVKNSKQQQKLPVPRRAGGGGYRRPAAAAGRGGGGGGGGGGADEDADVQKLQAERTANRALIQEKDAQIRKLKDQVKQQRAADEKKAKAAAAAAATK